MTRRSMTAGLAAAVASLLMLGAALRAQAPAIPPAAPQAKSSGGMSEGIKVHGRWTIDVRNPDGSLASHTDFNNALHPGGAYFLTQLLARRESPLLWVVELFGPLCQMPDPEFPAGPCEIREPSDTWAGAWVFKTLSLSVPPSGPNADRLVLSGTARAHFAGQLTAVHTEQWRCTTSTVPCGAARSYGFSGTTLPAPISVSAGQSIDVTVVISFS